MSTSLFLYEPFYGFERLINEAFDARSRPSNSGSAEQRQDTNKGVRILRPR